MAKTQAPAKEQPTEGTTQSPALPPLPEFLQEHPVRTVKQNGEDRAFLLQVANRTVEKVDLAMYGRILQIAWVLAAKMERAKELRQCLYDGLVAISCYIDEKPKTPFNDEMFEGLSQATEVARDILENSGEIERTQAGAAVLSGRVKFESDADKITDREVVLR